MKETSKSIRLSTRHWYTPSLVIIFHLDLPSLISKFSSTFGDFRFLPFLAGLSWLSIRTESCSFWCSSNASEFIPTDPLGLIFGEESESEDNVSKSRVGAYSKEWINTISAKVYIPS